MAWDIGSKPPSKSGGSKAQNPLFRRSRWQLAVLYASVMGAILTVLGAGVYRAIAHAHEVTVDRELESVAEVIRNNLQAELSSANELEQLPAQRLPGLCVLPEQCLTQANTPLDPLQDANQDYYIRVVGPAGELLAIAGLRPEGLPVTQPPFPYLEPLYSDDGQEYHQVALALSPSANDAPSAYLLVGRSFQDFNEYLALVRWSLLLGLLIALELVVAASWWLADLAMRPIYQSYSQMQQFTADAAHELRTPLAAMGATLESVLRLPQLTEADTAETLTVIARQNNRLATLVNDLLFLSRLDNQKYPVQKQTCSLPDLLHDIGEEIAAFALAKDILLSVEIESPPLFVLGNEEQLYRLVLNLVNNALTYTPAGGQVTLRLRQRQQQALIEVQDTGIGISPKHQGRIFDRFYRVDESRSGQSGNSGLGLAIAAAIAQAHGGSISVSSQLNQGSVFKIALPVSS